MGQVKVESDDWTRIQHLALAHISCSMPLVRYYIHGRGGYAFREVTITKQTNPNSTENDQLLD